MPFIIPANTLAASGFDVANSCRFDSASQQTLEKSQSAGNRNTATFSAWIKRTELSSNLAFFAIYGAQSDAGQIEIRFNGTGDGLQIGGYATVWEKTSASFRDIAAWYHVVVAIDTTDSTANDRIKIYVNGVLQAAAATGDLGEDEDLPFGLNNADVVIGSRKMSGGLRDFFSGYMAEVVLIDGAALAPTSFGEFDDSGIWKPIDVSGLTFGTNGFYLDFEDSSNLGNDANGGTDFTESNLAATDQSLDVPTNNFAIMNPLIYGANYVFAEGNLQVSQTATAWNSSYASIGVTSGKWYMEILRTAGGHFDIGVTDVVDATGNVSQNSGCVAYKSNGEFARAGAVGDGLPSTITNPASTTYAINDIVSIALDVDNEAVYFAKNGVWEVNSNPESGSSKTGAVTLPNSNSTYFFAFAPFKGGSASSAAGQANFGSPPYAISSGNADGNGYGNFEYAVPSGYFSLNTKNLAEYG